MSVILHKAGLTHARSLIQNGSIDKDSSWSFSAEDGNKMLGADGNDWKNYASFHLGENIGAAEETKARYNYPFGKDGKVYRSGLTAIRQRAGQQNEQDIFDAAGILIEIIDKKEKKVSGKFPATLGNLKDSVIAKTFCMSAVDLGGQAPDEFQLMPCGKWDGFIHPDRGTMSLVIKPEHLIAAVVYHNDRRSRAPQRDLVIDYEHQTLKGGNAPAAGWMPRLEVRGNILYATDVTWTPKAKKHIEDSEYRYISPVFAFDVTDKKSGKIIPMAVFNAALTNEPFFDELEPIVSKDNSQNLFIFSKENLMDELLQRLMYFLNLPITSTASDILAELDKMIGQIKTLISSTATQAVDVKAILQFLTDTKEKYSTLSAKYLQTLQALGLGEDASPEQVKAIFAAKTDTSGFVAKADYQKLLDQINNREVDELIAKALQLGKITPATKEEMKAWALKDRKGFEAFIAKVTEYSVVPLQQIKITGDAPGKGSGLTEVDLLIAKQLGVTKEQLDKHNKIAC
jgi:phage I-like protein